MTSPSQQDVLLPPCTPSQSSIKRPSSELGSPSLSLTVPLDDTTLNTTLSPSLQYDDDSDDMSIPSSPLSMERLTKRRLSKQPALLSRQKERPFRFLDLPPEIRNMIYFKTFFNHEVAAFVRSCDYWTEDFNVLPYMEMSWRPPVLATVNKLLRKEALSLYYSTTELIWYWDPLRARNDYDGFNLYNSVALLGKLLQFVARHDIRIKGILVCSPDFQSWPALGVVEILDSVRLLGPIRRALDGDGRHALLGQISFRYNRVAQTIFELAGSLDASMLQLRNKKLLDSKVRSFLRTNHHTTGMLRVIEDMEAQDYYDQLGARRERKEERRQENIKKGGERWDGVLRGRAAKKV
jgi:hypothetical protein